MKFINKTTGIILEPSSEFVVEQMKKSVDYKEYKEPKQEIKQEVKQEVKTKATRKNKNK